MSGPPGPRPALVVSAALLLVAGCSVASDPAPSRSGDTISPPSTFVAPDVVAPDAPGPNRSGHATIRLVDRARFDRPLAVELWWPAPPEIPTGPQLARYGFAPGVEVLGRSLDGAAVAPGGPFPLIVYSHGSGAQPYQSFSLAERLAEHGFVVAAPGHLGNRSSDVFAPTAAAAEIIARDRLLDVAFVLDALLEPPGDTDTDAAVLDAVDAERVGLMGHSLGGYTALAVAGDPRVDAVVALAPATNTLGETDLAAVRVPTLLVGGSADATTPVAENVERPHRLVPGRPSLRVDLRGAGHNSFTDVCAAEDAAARADGGEAADESVARIVALAEQACGADLMAISRAHTLIETYVVSFLYRHVAGEAAYEAYLTDDLADTLSEVSLDRRD